MKRLITSFLATLLTAPLICSAALGNAAKTASLQDDRPIYQWYVDNVGADQLWIIDEDLRLPMKGAPGADLDLPKAMPAPKHRVKVAIIDSGMDVLHPEIRPNTDGYLGSLESTVKKQECDGYLRYAACKLVARNREASVACDKTHLTPENDFDGNGFPLDCFGWDMSAKADWGDRTVELEPGNAATRVPMRGLPFLRDTVGHGTHVGGIVGAAGIKNRTAFMKSPFAGSIRLIPIKVLDSTSQDVDDESDHDGFEGRRFTENVGHAIYYAVARGAEVINLSLGWPSTVDTTIARQAIQYALSKGVLVVAAAGNDSSDRPVVPCTMAGVICVGATWFDGRPAYFSNFGSSVDLHAPGEYIFSSIPAARRGTDFTAYPGYDYLSGTSMATPFVTAALAVCLAQDHPAEECRARLLASARALPTPEALPLSLFPSVVDRHGQRGNLSVRGMLEQSPRPWIYPRNKATQSILVESGARSFMLTTQWSNHWATASEVRLACENSTPDNGHHVPGGMLTIGNWAGGASHDLKLEIGLIPTAAGAISAAEGEVVCRVQSIDSVSGAIYNDQFSLSYDLQLAVRPGLPNSIARTVIDAAGREVRLSDVIGSGADKKSLEYIDSIDLAASKMEAPAFVIYARHSSVQPATPTPSPAASPGDVTGKEPPGTWEIQRLIPEGDSHLRVTETVTLAMPSADCDIYRAQEVDLNFDGRNDLALVSRCVAVGEHNLNRRPRTFMVYLTSDLKPLPIVAVAQKPPLATTYTNIQEIDSTVTEFPPFEYAWIKVGPRLTPVWFNYGGKPPLEQVAGDSATGPWAGSPYTGKPDALRRLYYLADDGMRSITAPKPLSFLRLLSQGADDQRTGRVTAIATSEEIWKLAYQIVTFDGIATTTARASTVAAKEITREVQLPKFQFLQFGYSMRTKSLDSTHASSSFITLAGKGRDGEIRYSTLTSNREGAVAQSGDVSRRANLFGGEDRSQNFSKLGGIFQGVEGGMRTSAFALSLFDLVYLEQDANGLHRTEIPLRRYSYLPGDTFDRTYFPVVARQGDRTLAAAYVPQGFSLSAATQVVVAIPAQVAGAAPGLSAGASPKLIRPLSLALYADPTATGCSPLLRSFEATPGRESSVQFVCGSKLVTVPFIVQ